MAATDRAGVCSICRRLRSAFSQALVVRHLVDEQPDFGSEVLLQLLGCRGGVLDRVVQECRDEGRDVRDAADVREDAGHFERMVDVGRRIIAFAVLVLMPIG